MKRRKLSQPGPASSSSINKSVRKTSSTQPSLDAFIDGKQSSTIHVDIGELVNDCVRYFVHKAGHKMPFKRIDMQKSIRFGGMRNFDQVMKSASEILLKVYGYKLITCENSSKFYILSNILPSIDEDEIPLNLELPSNANDVLLKLILLHIFMSNTVVTEESMSSFLRSIEIDVNRRHEIFGNVNEYLMTVLPRQHYLKLEKDSIAQNIVFAWGQRAEREISKHKLLKFACKIYRNNSKPNSWITKFQEAEKQANNFERHTDHLEEVDQSNH